MDAMAKLYPVFYNLWTRISDKGKRKNCTVNNNDGHVCLNKQFERRKCNFKLYDLICTNKTY